MYFLDIRLFKVIHSLRLFITEETQTLNFFIFLSKFKLFTKDDLTPNLTKPTLAIPNLI